MAVARQGQIRPKGGVIRFKMGIPVGQQQPESVADGVPDIPGHLLGRFLVGEAVGVVDARHGDGAAVPLQRYKGVAQIGDAAFLQQRRQLRHGPGSPLMIAGDEIRRRHSRQPTQQRPQIFRAAPLVHQVAHQRNDIGPGLPHRLQKAAVVPAEPAAMEIRQHHDPGPVPPLRQPPGGEGVFLGGEGVVPPPQARPGQGQRCQQQRQGRVFPFAFLVQPRRLLTGYSII